MLFEEIKLDIGLTNKVSAVIDKDGNNHLLYKTEDIEVITRDMLETLSKKVKSPVILCTNAGIDLHSSESSFKQIKCVKHSYDEMEVLFRGMNKLITNSSKL